MSSENEITAPHRALVGAERMAAEYENWESVPESVKAIIQESEEALKLLQQRSEMTEKEVREVEALLARIDARQTKSPRQEIIPGCESYSRFRRP